MAGQRAESAVVSTGTANSEPHGLIDPVLDSHGPSLSASASDLLQTSLRHPLVLARIELRLARRLARIALGGTPMTPAVDDRRFEDAAWYEQPVFRRALQGYLAGAEALSELVEQLPTDPAMRQRLHFLVQHFNAATAPSNLFLTHPGFYARLRATRGRSLGVGLAQLAHDLRHRRGLPQQVDERAFTLGVDLAATPGAVVHREALFELIQYAPLTVEQDACPLLCVPPQINKYYVMDLGPHNSLVRAALAAGQAVYMISWRNPTAAQRDWGLAEYVRGVNTAIDTVREITGGTPVKLMGACAGGLTAALALAWRRAQSADTGVACLSLLVTLLAAVPADATAGGDNRAIRQALARSSRTGVLDGADMARAFARLRPDDLIWRFVTHNYVLGKRPPAHDILFWNADTTRLPARLHADLLSIYSADLLARPDALIIDETPIDLSRIDCDVFLVAGERDHIAPWTACHRMAARLSGHVRLVLVDAGHVQSMVCPPGEATHYQSDTCSPAESPTDWQDRAVRYEGSWWGEWLAWCSARGSASPGPAPREYGSPRHPAIEAAPGRYVRQR